MRQAVISFSVEKIYSHSLSSLQRVLKQLCNVVAGGVAAADASGGYGSRYFFLLQLTHAILGIFLYGDKTIVFFVWLLYGGETILRCCGWRGWSR